MRPLSTGFLLPTTVVGSYPVVRGGFHPFDPLAGAVKTAVADQIGAGIDIISDGQVRGDMIRAFAAHLPGVHGQDVIGQVYPPAEQITVPDTRYALNRHRLVKGIITGPTTLSHALHISTRIYRDRQELALDLAKALEPEVRNLEKAGACMIQIDEPILSTGTADPEGAARAIQQIGESLSVPVCLHVCGALGEIIDTIRRMPVDIFDFEFARAPENLGIVNAADIGERMIGFGCVDSADPAVESEREICMRIEKGIEIFGPGKILVDPDCGLRMLPRDSALGKLSHMTAAARRIRATLDGKA
jgi:5-methyltetrahydropteroyltriglutamate--homocysteine methyltransferase